MTALNYLKIADKVFTHELHYCTDLLEPETRLKLMGIVEQELISKWK
jgi:hypothetical protein